mmetsp:Transcript_19851/g.39925  ORF Transcript_19851/g.39925 Transcript_19851/m.39925 type:complete len:124 (+) Transcript_19851:1647-2018(+)
MSVRAKGKEEKAQVSSEWASRDCTGLRLVHRPLRRGTQRGILLPFIFCMWQTARDVGQSTYVSGNEVSILPLATMTYLYYCNRTEEERKKERKKREGKENVSFLWRGMDSVGCWRTRVGRHSH